MKKVVLIFSIAILGFAANYEKDIEPIIRERSVTNNKIIEVKNSIVAQEEKIKKLEAEFEALSKTVAELEKIHIKDKK